MRKRVLMRTIVKIGLITDDAGRLAAKVVQSLCSGPRIVWADEEGVVLSACVDALSNVPTQWIVGTFGLGQPVADIEEDLREVARGHVATTMLVT